MSNKRPLVLDDGRVREASAADTLRGPLGGSIREVVTQNVTITVAATSGTRQAGDWPDVGAAGIRTAYDYLQTFSPATPDVRLTLSCRDGRYNFVNPFVSGQSLVYISAITSNTAPNTVDPASLYVATDAAVRLTQMRTLWSVEFNFETGADNISRVLVGNASGLVLSDILIVSKLDTITVSACFVEQGGSLALSACGVYGSGYGVRTQTGGVFRVAEFIHATSQSTAGLYASGFSSMFVFSTGKDSIIARSGSLSVAIDSNSAIEIRMSGATSTYLRNVSGSCIYADTGGRFFASRSMDLAGCTRGVQGLSGGAVEIRSGVKIRGNSSVAVQLTGGAQARLENIDVDPLGSATQRTVQVTTNATLDLRGSTPETILSPAEGTTGNNGGVIF